MKSFFIQNSTDWYTSGSSGFFEGFPNKNYFTGLNITTKNILSNEKLACYQNDYDNAWYCSGSNLVNIYYNVEWTIWFGLFKYLCQQFSSNIQHIIFKFTFKLNVLFVHFTINYFVMFWWTFK
jgi:hypothetical protein